MNLLADLEAFVRDHGSHGGVSGDATQTAWNGYLLTVAVRRGVRAVGCASTKIAQSTSQMVTYSELGASPRLFVEHVLPPL
jgi:hypothetical protein